MKFTIVLLALILCPAVYSDSFAENKCVPQTQRDCAIVLTFDDGPRKEILEGVHGLLPLLKKHRIEGAFFGQGWQIKSNPDLVKEIVRQGHLIANHTYGHGSLTEIAKRIAKSKTGQDDLWKRFIADAREEFIKDAERAGLEIKNIVGYTPLFIRPPKWDIDQELYCMLTERRMIVQITEKGIHDFRCRHLESIIIKNRILVPNEPREAYQNQMQEAERLRRDVNTEDYAVYEWYLKKKDERFDAAVEKLVQNIKGVIVRRESSGARIHIFTFHELSIAVGALRILIPEWKSQGYRFENLPWVYGISEGWFPLVSVPDLPENPRKFRKK